MSSRSRLTTDWFDRRSEDAYTFADPSKRLLDWDYGRTSFASYFMRDNPASDAGKMLGSMFRVLNVPKTRRFCSDAKEAFERHSASSPAIHIPIHMIRDEDGNYQDDPKKLDAFYGACLQHAAMQSLQTNMEYNKTLKRMGDPSMKQDTEQFLSMILNAERVDRKLGDKTPGYLKFVQKFKDHAYDENYQAPSPLASQGERLLDLVTRMIRYPANITEEELKEFETPLKEIQKIMKRAGGIPEDFRACDNMAAKISSIIHAIEPPPPPEGCSGGGDGEGDGDSKDENSDGGDGPSDSSSGGGTPPPSDGKSSLDKAAKRMMEQLFEMKHDSSGQAESDLEDFEASAIEPDSDYSEEGEALDSKISFKQVPGDKARYMDDMKKFDMAKAQTLARLFARKNKDYQFSMRSMRSGRLDTGKLAEAKQNVPTIYERIGQVKTDKVMVGVLIDESGSMSGTKEARARQAAVFINEVFKKMHNVELFIYGHSADQDSEVDHSTEVYVYREPGKAVDPYALGSSHARCENRDGDAILATARRIRRFTQTKGILFVISDGQPCANDYHGTKSIEDTKNKVKRAEDLGFQVIQIAIESSVPSERMFKHYIKMTDIKNLPKDMVLFLSKKVDHLIKERVFV